VPASVASVRWWCGWAAVALMLLGAVVEVL